MLEHDAHISVLISCTVRRIKLVKPMKTLKTLCVGTDFNEVASLANEALTVVEKEGLLDCVSDFVSAVYLYRSYWHEMPRAEMKQLEDEIVIRGQEVHKLMHSLLQKVQLLTSANKIKCSSDKPGGTYQSQLSWFVGVGRKYMHWLRLCMRDRYGTDVNDPMLNGFVRFLYRFQYRLQQLR